MLRNCSLTPYLLVNDYARLHSVYDGDEANWVSAHWLILSDCLLLVARHKAAGEGASSNCC